MDKTSAVVGGIVLLAVLGFAAFMLVSPTTPAAETPNAETPAPTVSTPGSPVATTDSLVVPTNTSAVVTGSISPNGALTTYWYEYGTTVAYGSKSATQAVGSGYISIPSPAYLVGLAKDTTYYYRVVAENRYGSVAGVQRSFVTRHDTPAPTGTAPSAKTLAATGITRTTANLPGEINPNSGATQYWFEYGTSVDLGNTTSFVSAGNGSTPVSASQSISNLIPLTTYYFRLNSQNQFGTVNGSILTFKTVGPALVPAPQATTRTPTAITASSATLRGTLTPNGANITYWFEYSTDANFVATLLTNTTHVPLTGTANATAVTAPVTGLKSNTTYHVRLVAENSVGLIRGTSISFKTK